MADAQQAGRTKVAVVGGGIAGLTAAWTLLQRGYEVTLFEERMYLGGKMGAHPARIPLWRRKRPLAPGEKQEIDEYIDLSSGEFQRDEKRGPMDAVLSKQLGAGLVPRFILESVTSYFLRVVKRLGLTIPAWEEYLSAGIVETLEHAPKEVERRSTDLNGARDKWEVRYAGVTVPGRDERVDVVFRVAIYEHDNGRAALELTDALYHEHCYHMFLNWYRNFWALMEEIGLERSTAFRPHDQIVHLFPGTAQLRKRSRALTTLGDFSHGAENLLSGAAEAPDMFLWLYSMVDLVSHQFDPSRYLDRRSVHAFLSSRWYSTDESVRFHEHLLAKAFAVPTYFSSAYTYRKYVEYSIAAPDPMLWVLYGDSYTNLFKPFEERLQEKDLKIIRGTQVCGISWDEGGLRIKLRASDMRGMPRNPNTGRRPDDDGEGPVEGSGEARLSIFSPDYIVVAVPPSALARLTGDFRNAVPGLATVRKLQSAVTAALDLHFRCKLPDIPRNHMVLRDSALGLTIMDNSQAWHDDPDDEQKAAGEAQPTHLSVAVTDFYKIDGMDKAEATAAILADLRRFITFADKDVDFTRTYLQMNNGEPLFINEVGSEPWRPRTITDIQGLFLAGDYCDNDIGIVSVEGAVVSGLLAARAVQAQLRADQPDILATDPRLEDIPILLPETDPLVNAEAVKGLLLPYAAMAYSASKQTEWARFPERAFTPRDMQFHLEQALQSAGAAPAIMAGLAAQTAQWVADLHARGRS